MQWGHEGQQPETLEMAELGWGTTQGTEASEDSDCGRWRKTVIRNDWLFKESAPATPNKQQYLVLTTSLTMLTYLPGNNLFNNRESGRKKSAWHDKLMSMTFPWSSWSLTHLANNAIELGKIEFSAYNMSLSIVLGCDDTRIKTLTRARSRHRNWE